MSAPKWDRLILARNGALVNTYTYIISAEEVNLVSI